MKLSDLRAGQSGIIIKILGHGAFRKRVMEMGFVKGRKVTMVLNAPLQDPIKFSLMDYEVSLRRAEANLIEVCDVDEWDNVDNTEQPKDKPEHEAQISRAKGAGSKPRSAERKQRAFRLKIA